MMNGPNLEQLETFLETVGRENLLRAGEETAYGNAESAFCISCAEEYDDLNFRAPDGCLCAACGEVAVYRVEDLLSCCDELGVL